MVREYKYRYTVSALKDRSLAYSLGSAQRRAMWEEWSIARH